MIKRAIAFLATAVMAAGVISPAYSHIAANAAEATSYTTVLEDLNRDPLFCEANYPNDNSDEVAVLQIAEGESGELFVYTLQYAGEKSLALQISLCPSLGYKDYQTYTLEAVSIEGIFGKYLVRGYRVKNNSSKRHYCIRSITSVFYYDNGDTRKHEWTVDKCFIATNADEDVLYTALKKEDEELTDFDFVSVPRGGPYRLDYYLYFNSEHPLENAMGMTIEYTYSTVRGSALSSLLFLFALAGKQDFDDGTAVRLSCVPHENPKHWEPSRYNTHYTWDFMTTENFIKSIEEESGGTVSDDKAAEIREKETAFLFRSANVAIAGNNLYQADAISSVDKVTVTFEVEYDVLQVGKIAAKKIPDEPVQDDTPKQDEPTQSNKPTQDEKPKQDEETPDTEETGGTTWVWWAFGGLVAVCLIVLIVIAREKK